MKKQPLLPTGWKQPRGYANGVAAKGVQVFIAGQIGWDKDEVVSSQ
jgi:enamine deaminase RidA (YjgF/YER057c/UK114 family)